MRVFACLLLAIAPLAAQQTVRGVMQPMPGEEMALIDAEVRRTPDNQPFVPASEVKLLDREIVLGITRDGQAWALPIRYLGQYEVLNQRFGDLPALATW